MYGNEVFSNFARTLSIATSLPGQSETISNNPSVLFGIVAIAMLCLFGMFMYFLPTFCALLTKHPQAFAIGLLNFLLGWTVLGWVASFIWAFVKPQPPVHVVHYVNQTAPVQLPPAEQPPIPPSRRPDLPNRPGEA